MVCHYIRSVFGALGIYTLEIGCQWCKKVPRSAIDTPLDEGQLVSRLDIHCCLSCLLNLNGSTLKFSLGGFFCKPIDCDWKDTKFQKDWSPLYYQNLHGSTNLSQYFLKVHQFHLHTFVQDLHTILNSRENGTHKRALHLLEIQSNYRSHTLNPIRCGLFEVLAHLLSQVNSEIFRNQIYFSFFPRYLNPRKKIRKIW